MPNLYKSLPALPHCGISRNKLVKWLIATRADNVTHIRGRVLNDDTLSGMGLNMKRFDVSQVII